MNARSIHNARTFRLFVSSTFSDFVAEREALQTRVFPKLEQYCASRGARFLAIDLRWGITEEAQQEHDTMRICLEEVRRSQQLSPRPNFAVLLGDRYGWEPIPARISHEHWERLKLKASAAEWGLISSSYRADTNSIPPVYCLLTQSLQKELLLQKALRHAASDFRGTARFPYFASATHQEIVLGALSKHDAQGQPLNPHEHVHAYVRHLHGLPRNSVAKDYIDWDVVNDCEVQGARKKLDGLKTQLRRKIQGNVHDLHACWATNDGDVVIDEAYIKHFCDLFISHQIALIDAELAKTDGETEFQKRESEHQQFGADRSRVFVGRESLLKKIADYISVPNNIENIFGNTKSGNVSPMFLVGEGGCGKSALIARAAQDAIQMSKRTGAMVLQRYVGGIPGTESLTDMLAALTADIAYLYGLPPPALFETIEDLIESFDSVLSQPNSKRPLILFIDSLDQLDQADDAWLLEWLPDKLSRYVRIVASVRSGVTVALSVKRRFPRGQVHVPQLKPHEGKAMLNAWLADSQSAWFNAGVVPPSGRRLTRLQNSAVIDAFNFCCSALWLKLASEEVATWASWDAPKNLPNTIEGLIKNLVQKRLLSNQKHPKIFTERALSYITASRFGISEVEIGRALGQDEIVRAEFQLNEKTQKKWSDEKSLPPILWSRLFFDLRAYLGLSEIDGVLVMRWFHREFSEVLSSIFLSSSEEIQAIHYSLARTFLSLDQDFRSTECGDDALLKATDLAGMQVSVSLRRVMEQPWHLALAGRQDELESLLSGMGFLLGKTAANRVQDLKHDFSLLYKRNEWSNFYDANYHLVKRGDDQWPAHRILLQVAAESSSESEITSDVDRWLRNGNCDWVWACNRNRHMHVTKRSAVVSVMEGHEDTILGVQELSDGRLLSWSSDATIKIWDCLSGDLLTVLRGHEDAVNGASLILDESVLSWSDDGTLRLWDLERGAMQQVYLGHSAAVNGALFIPTNRVLSWAKDSTLRVWDLKSGIELMVLSGHSAEINGARLMADERVLTWSSDSTLCVWDIQIGTLIGRFTQHEGRVWGAQVVHDNQVLSWGADKNLILWDSHNFESLISFNGHKDSIQGAEVLEDGRMLSWSDDATLRLWDSKNGATITAFEGHVGTINGARFLSDGRLLSWSRDKTLRIWDVNSGQLYAVLKGHTGWVSSALVLLDARILSWAMGDRNLRLWDAKDGKEIGKLEGHSGWIRSALLLQDGHVVSWATDVALRVWNSRHFFTLIAEDCNHSESIRGASFLPGERLLTWSEDATLRIWDCASGEALHVLRGHSDVIRGVQLLASNRLLSWSNDACLRIWDLVDGEALLVLEGHTNRVIGAFETSDGNILSWSLDKTIRIWDSSSGKALVFFAEHDLMIKGVLAISKSRVLSWSLDSELKIWDIFSGKALATMSGHDCGINGALEMKDGRVLSWSDDGTLRIWEGQHGEELLVLKGHSDAVCGALLFSDGEVLSWSDDLTLRLWDGKTGELLATLVGHSERIEGVQLISDDSFVSWSEDQTLRRWSRHDLKNHSLMNEPWIAEISSDSSWCQNLTKVGTALRVGNAWIQPNSQGVLISDRYGQWSAMWHGPSNVFPIGLSSNTIVCYSGSNLVWLQLKHGDALIPIE